MGAYHSTPSELRSEPVHFVRNQTTRKEHVGYLVEFVPMPLLSEDERRLVHGRYLKCSTGMNPKPDFDRWSGIIDPLGSRAVALRVRTEHDSEFWWAGYWTFTRPDDNGVASMGQFFNASPDHDKFSPSLDLDLTLAWAVHTANVLGLDGLSPSDLHNPDFIGDVDDGNLGGVRTSSATVTNPIAASFPRYVVVQLQRGSKATKAFRAVEDNLTTLWRRFAVPQAKERMARHGQQQQEIVPSDDQQDSASTPDSANSPRQGPSTCPYLRKIERSEVPKPVAQEPDASRVDICYELDVAGLCQFVAATLFRDPSGGILRADYRAGGASTKASPGSQAARSGSPSLRQGKASPSAESHQRGSPPPPPPEQKGSFQTHLGGVQPPGAFAPSGAPFRHNNQHQVAYQPQHHGATAHAGVVDADSNAAHPMNSPKVRRHSGSTDVQQQQQQHHHQQQHHIFQHHGHQHHQGIVVGNPPATKPPVPGLSVGHHHAALHHHQHLQHQPQYGVPAPHPQQPMQHSPTHVMYTHNPYASNRSLGAWQ